MLKTPISILMAGCLALLPAAPGSIGVVQSTGEFRVDGSAVRGNSTLFEGSVVETISARSVLQLRGVEVTLLPDSRVTVFRDHVEAGTLRIASAGRNSAMQLETAANGRLAIAARSGSAEVRNSAGNLIAVVRPGMALALDPQAAANTVFKVAGVVEVKDGRFFVTENTTNVKIEIQGADLAQYAGKSVEITGASIPGAPLVNGASAVVRVASVTVLRSAAAAAGAGASGAASGAGAGISTGATVAIVGGVAAAGSVAGLAAVGTFNSEPSVSVK